MGKTHCEGPITLRATCLVPVSDGHFTLCLLVCMGPQASGQIVCITIDANIRLIKKKKSKPCCIRNMSLPALTLPVLHRKIGADFAKCLFDLSLPLTIRQCQL